MEITPNERDAVYKTIFSRRDVRGQFLPDEIPEDVLMRVLTAACLLYTSPSPRDED